MKRIFLYSAAILAVVGLKTHGQDDILPNPLPGINGAAGTAGVSVYYLAGLADVVAPISVQADILQQIADGDLDPDVFTSQIPTLALDDPTSLGGGQIQPKHLIPGDGGDDYIVTVKGAFRVDNPGIHTVWVQSDDGFGLRFNGLEPIANNGGEISEDILFFAGDTGNTNTRATFDLPAGVTTFDYMFWENGGGAFAEIATAKGDFLDSASAQWLALGNGAVVPESQAGSVARLSGPMFIGTTEGGEVPSAQPLLDTYDQLIEMLANNNFAEESEDTEYFVIDDDRGDEGGCPFGDRREARAELGDDVPRWPNSDLGDVNDFAAYMTGSLVIDDGDETPGETHDVIFHIDSDDKSIFRIKGQSFDDVIGDFSFEIDGDESLFHDAGACIVSTTGHISLEEGTYEYEAVLQDQSGDAGIQILSTTGTLATYSAATLQALSVEETGFISVPANVGLPFVNPEGGDPCDFDGDGALGLGDVNMLLGAVAAGANELSFDITGDGSVNIDDIKALVTGSSKLNTWMGDSNLDGEFNSGDLVGVFQAGKFETGAAADWGQGDWNGDGVFGSGDLVAAFQDGGFEQGPRGAAVASVPEPTSTVLALFAAIGLLGMIRRK